MLTFVLQAIQEDEPFFGPSLLMFSLIGAGVILCLSDTYTTMLGFEVGFTEGNPVARWLQKKLGFTLSAFATTGAFLLVASLLYGFAPFWIAVTFAVVIICIEATMTVRNYRMYRAEKKQRP